MKNIALEGQMELTLQNAAARARQNRKSARPRALWWFTQMRRVVDKAIDRSPRQAPRPHQAYFTLDRQPANW